MDEVVALFERYGEETYDEEVSQLAHALQAAALASSAGASSCLVAACLLHDVGHLLELEDHGGADAARHSSDLRHEAAGAAYLAGLYPPGVTAPIALHVRAKRYLCAVDPAYQDALSLGSTASLQLQGGPMSDDEIAAAGRLSHFEDAVALRRFDDAAKVVGLDVPPLSHYEPELRALVRGQAASRAG